MSADERDIHIGKNLTSRRGVRSQQALARAMRNRGWKWSQATASAIEKGERPLKLAEAIDLADELNVRLEDLIQEPEQAAASREVGYRARQVAFHAASAIKVLIGFERERRGLLAAIEEAAKVPGWERPQAAAQALDQHTLDKLIHMTRVILDSEQLTPLNLESLTPEELARVLTRGDLDSTEGDADGIGHEAT
ncbi:helix-turn-helix protein [Promicromonospora sp. AC04]|uniref:helix-turn-helix domain-containing protein n=1 Tax=Promicromonospora sp. AC04 TaxID=2135723 RepID=UPI000D390C9B|nr:helix-turn-helix transcriptional regulator [Promicromonospora sp. AC04]PUB26799.1 helix-turn-helix protein [Promicromonospora sp. AC04]